MAAAQWASSRTHAGRRKVADLPLEFFGNDEVAKGVFLKAGKQGGRQGAGWSNGRTPASAQAFSISTVSD